MRMIFIASLFLFFIIALPALAAPGDHLKLEMEIDPPVDTSLTPLVVTENNFALNGTRAYGSFSGDFDSANNTLLSVPDNADWAMGTGRATIDLWIKIKGLGPAGGQAQGIFQQYQDDNNFMGLRIENPASGLPYLVFQIRSGGANILFLPTVSFSYSTSEWTHIAVIRGWGGNANEWAITVNGKRQPLQAPYSYFASINWPDFNGGSLGSAFEIGRGKDLPFAGFGYINAYIDRFRVTKGEVPVETDLSIDMSADFSPKFRFTTEPATSISEGSATLNGLLFWNIAETDDISYSFEYGTGGEFTNIINAMAMSSDFFGIAGPGLTASTPYNFRARISDNGYYYGNTRVFTTSADSNPPTVQIMSPPAGAVNQNPITVSGAATDATAIDPASVAWNNSTSGEAGTCSFDGLNFTCSVRLQNGNNTIVVSARDTSNNLGSASVVYNLVGIGATGNISGYAWSEHYGWISFSSTDCDTDGDGTKDVSGCGSGNIAQYGVRAVYPSGNLTGYAWSDIIGWIVFHRPRVCSGNNAIYCETDLNCTGFGTCSAYQNLPDDSVLAACSNCSPAAGCSACYNRTSHKLIGWAKVLSMGDDGWMRLDDDNTSDGIVYGVTHRTNNHLYGWAWGSNLTRSAGTGWISFHCDESAAAGDPDDGAALCSTVNYSVKADFNTPPTVSFPDPGEVIPSPCRDYQTDTDQPLRVFLRWIFQDADGDTQAAYNIKVFSTNPAGNNPVLIKSYYGETDAGQYSLTIPDVDWNRNYNYLIQVKDSMGASSTEYSYKNYRDTLGLTPKLVITPRHDYPDVYFTWKPYNFSAGEQVLFYSIYNRSGYYNNSNTFVPCPLTQSNNCFYEWFVNGALVKSGFTDASSTVVVVSEPGIENMVSLKITDGAPTNYSCSTSSVPFSATFRLPSWVEFY